MIKVIVFVLTILIASVCKAACSGLTNQQYASEIVKILATNIPNVDPSDAFNVPYLKIMSKKILTYRNTDRTPNGTVDLASTCFARDMVKDLTGIDLSIPANMHYFKDHLLPDGYGESGW